MSDELPEPPFIASVLSYADVYHTTRCRYVSQSDRGVLSSVSESAIEWHDLEHCQSCAAEFDQGSRVDTTGLHAHLKRETGGRLVCEHCGSKITIDPNTGSEYGHARKRYTRLPETRGRCPYRPGGVDPHGGFGRSKIHEVDDD